MRFGAVGSATSSASAAGWNLNALAPTEASLEPLEYRFTRYGLCPTCIDVIAPASDLGFPLVAEIDSVQTSSDAAEPVGTLTAGHEARSWDLSREPNAKREAKA